MPEFGAWFWIICIGISIVVTVASLVVAFRSNNPDDWIGLKRLAEEGVNLELQRTVEFRLFCPTEGSATHLQRILTADGYDTVIEHGQLEVRTRSSVAAPNEAGYLMRARKAVVLYGDVTKTTRARLTALASAENGRYLGWEAIDKSNYGQLASSDAVHRSRTPNGDA